MAGNSQVCRDANILARPGVIPCQRQCWLTAWFAHIARAVTAAVIRFALIIVIAIVIIVIIVVLIIMIIVVAAVTRVIAWTRIVAIRAAA